MPYWFTSAQPEAFGYAASTERPVIGCIGTGSRWGAVGPQSFGFGDCAAVCDVDANHAGKAKERVEGIQKKKRAVGAASGLAVCGVGDAAGR